MKAEEWVKKLKPKMKDNVIAGVHPKDGKPIVKEVETNNIIIAKLQHGTISITPENFAKVYKEEIETHNTDAKRVAAILEKSPSLKDFFDECKKDGVVG